MYKARTIAFKELYTYANWTEQVLKKDEPDYRAYLNTVFSKTI